MGDDNVSVMKWIVVRVLIGFAIALIGLLIAVVTNDMNLSYNVFSMCGLGMAGLGTFAVGYGSKHGKAIEGKNFLTIQGDRFLEVEQGFNEDLAWSINMLIIGGVNFLVPALAYVIINA